MQRSRWFRRLFSRTPSVDSKRRRFRLESLEDRLALSTFTVVNTDDSGSGSLRQAILDANATANSGGPDLIDFNILGTGVQTISPLSALPAITDPVVIDGYTQPWAVMNSAPDGFNGNLLIQLNGAAAGSDVNGIHVNAGGSTVRGLVINRFDRHGITIDGMGGNSITGNFIGTDPSGAAALGNGFFGILIEHAPSNVIGGVTAEARNVISGTSRSGVAVSGDLATTNSVQGNYIGTDAHGSFDLGNLVNGIEILGAAGTTVGGSAPGAGNLISGNNYAGIVVLGTPAWPVTGTTIQGNKIGTQVNGIGPLGNGSHGIRLLYSSNNVTIGGVPNIIAYNGLCGVEIEFGTGQSGNSILGNSIHANGQLGIDLGTNGVTPNDVRDGDTGPNNLQNFPVISSLRPMAGNTSISGSLNSTPNTQFRVEFFANDALEPGGFGEGQTFLGFVNVTTDSNGNASLQCATTRLIQAGKFVTATATDPNGNTSEFSQAVEVVTFIDFDRTTPIVSEGNSGTVPVVFNVYLSQPNPQGVRADFMTSSRSAESGSDFLPTSGFLTFSANETLQRITVQVLGDTVFERHEDFLISLANAVGAVHESGPIVGFIVNDDPLPSISINDRTLLEGNSGTTDVVFSATLSHPSSEGVWVEVATATDTASSAGLQADYVATMGLLSFAPLETSKAFTVRVNGDVVFEADESFLVNLSNAVGATIEDAQGVGTILNDDEPPTLSINDASVQEGDNGTTNAVFTVTLSAPSDQTVTVSFATAAGTAEAGEDYQPTMGILTFIPQQASQHVTVLINGDATFEEDETFFVNLSAPRNALVVDGQGLGTVRGDDLSIGNVAGPDTDSRYAFSVRLSSTSDQLVRVAFATADGSAIAGSDYDSTSGTLTFAPGQTVRFVTVHIIGDDLDEPNETFLINLSDPVGATLEDAQGVGTIEAAPRLSINEVAVVEGDHGTTNAVLTLTLSTVPKADVSVAFATVSGQLSGAASGVDFEPAAGTVSFSSFQRTQRVTVRVNGDLIDEPNETFHIVLSDAANAVLTDNVGTVTILNDDATPFVVGADAGGGPHVRTLSSDGRERLSFYAFNPEFSGGVRVATGDVTGDGTPDIIAAAGPGAGPHVRVFDGITSEQVPGAIGSFYAYDPAFTGGVFVAAADFDGDGLADVLTGPGVGGGPHIRVFSGRDGTELVGFFDDSKGGGGVRVATGDIDGDGTPDIIAAMGPGGVGPGGVPDLVRVFSGLSGREVAGAAGRISAYPGFGGGVYVAGGDVNGDGRDDVITGAGAGGGPHVRAFSGVDGSELASFFAYNAAFTGGVRVGVGDVDQDGDLEIITGAGPGGGPHVRAFDVLDDGEVASFFAFDPAFGGGVFVAGSPIGGGASSAALESDLAPALSMWLDAGVERSPEPTASTVGGETERDAQLQRLNHGNSRDLAFTSPDSLFEDWSPDDGLHGSSPEFSWPELADLALDGLGELL